MRSSGRHSAIEGMAWRAGAAGCGTTPGGGGGRRGGPEARRGECARTCGREGGREAGSQSAASSDVTRR